jgi:hypothetical protein
MTVSARSIADVPEHPIQFDVDCPDRKLDRLTTFDFAVGVAGWQERVAGYATLLVTDALRRPASTELAVRCRA